MRQFPLSDIMGQVWLLPNNWSVNFSGSITSLPNGFIIENGVLPYFPVSLSASDEAQKIDTIIEAAKASFQKRVNNW